MYRMSATSAIAQQEGVTSKLLYMVSGAPQHDRQPHPETAKRVPAILAALERTGVMSSAHADKARNGYALDCLAFYTFVQTLHASAAEANDRVQSSYH